MDVVTLGAAKADAKRKYAGKPGTRTGYQPVTAPNATNAASVLDIWQRTMVKFPFAISRYRVGFANRNLRSITIPTTPATITGVFRGAPAYDAAASGGNRWLGQCTAALTSISGTLSIPIDGSRVWTAWDTSGIPANTDTVFSMGLTTPATGTGIAGGNGYQGIYGSGAANAGNATVTSPQTLTTAMRLDIVIEYEFSDAVQCGLFLADSRGLPYSPSAPQGVTNAGPGGLPAEGFPALSGAIAGFAAVNMGVGSATLADLTTDYVHQWTRMDLTKCTFDFAVVALGTNGLTSGLSAFQDGLKLITDKLRTDFGITKIFWTTITPRGYPTGSHTSGGIPLGGFLAANCAAGATSISTDFLPATGLLTIGTGQTMEDVTVSAVSGTGPYTATINATANAHYAGEKWAQGNERSRVYINSYLRNLPYGITGVFDFEKLLESKLDSFMMDPRYTSTDWLHSTRAASLEQAKLVALAGTKVKLG